MNLVLLPMRHVTLYRRLLVAILWCVTSKARVLEFIKLSQDKLKECAMCWLAIFHVAEAQ